MTPAARATQIAALRARLAAWDPARYGSLRISRAARTRTLHALRRLERAAGLPLTPKAPPGGGDGARA